MKRKLQILFIIILLATVPLFLMAQQPPHPNGGNSPGAGNDPVGGGAPIGGGMCILIAMGVAYGAGKLFKGNKYISSVSI